MSTSDLVAQAIREGSNIEATYGEHPRLLTPIAVGRNGTKPQGLFVQYGGSSATGPIPGWRCLELAKLSSVRVIPGPPHLAEMEGLKPSTCLDYVDVSIRGFSGPASS